jgi:hypothetical protein
VSLTFVIDQTPKPPTLGERLISKASLKAKQWKAQLDSRPRGFFGSVRRPGVYPFSHHSVHRHGEAQCNPVIDPFRNLVLTLLVGVPITSVLSTDVQTPFTPAFACTYDSNKAAGGMGYWATLEVMHYKARYSGWKTYLAGEKMGEAKQGFAGSLPPRISPAAAGAAGEGAVFEGTGEVNEVDAGATSPEDAVEGDDIQARSAAAAAEKDAAAGQLEENAIWINELLGWQEMRAFNGVKDVGERENLVGELTIRSSYVSRTRSERQS